MPPKRSRPIQDHNSKLTPFARKLRAKGTKAEACLWKYVLADRQLLGFRFRRQRPVLRYIADFTCKELMLIIEVDGSVHLEPEVAKKDLVRDEALRTAGYTVLRFTNNEVLKHIDIVGTAIEDWVSDNCD